MIRPILSGLILAMLILSACGPGPAPQPVVPLPTYATGLPLVTKPGTIPPTTDPNFWSNGSEIQGWWWIRDDAYQNTANWIVDIPAGTEDITLNLTVLATEKAGGGRGTSAVFFLSYGQPNVTVYGRKLVELPNTSPASDPLGYTCTGTLTLTRAEIKNVARLWLKASRKDDLGEFPPSTVHVAFNKQSIIVIGK